MSDVIFKYPLDLGLPVTLQLPRSAQPLFVGAQGQQPYLWVRQIPAAVKLVPRYFEIVGTGDHFPKGAQYIGSFQQPPFVWHVIELLA